MVLRLVQGFAVAGEFAGASSMILEHAPPGRRGFYASFTLQGVQAGQVLAAAIFLPLAYFMPEEAFNSWGWRIPFLLSAAVLLAAFIIRREVEEPVAFTQKVAQVVRQRSPIGEAFKHSWRGMLVVLGVSMITALLPALFTAVAPPGSDNVPLLIGAITCLVTALSAIAAWSAPETHRTPIDQLGKADAVSLDKPTYDALRANALTGNQP
ncbi:MFS family permease [Pseudomonas sp. 2835]